MNPAQRTHHSLLTRSTAIAVTLSSVSKVVRSHGGRRVILDGVSLDFKAGEFVGVLGASGSGKSTLVKLLAGLTSASAGEIRFDGHPVGGQSLREDLRVAYLPQEVIVHEPLTPTQALGYVARLKGLAASADPTPLVDAALAKVGLSDRGHVAIRRLSGGQRKRVGLAAELLGDPRLILLDEATSGLDPATEAEMMALFRSLADEGRTVVCITHFPGRLHLCDRLVCLKDGVCAFDGPPDEMLRFFGVSAVEDVYIRLAERPVEEWRKQYEVTYPPGEPFGETGEPDKGVAPARAGLSVSDQILTLLGRYTRLQFGDVQALSLQALQAPIIAAMIAASFGNIRSSFAEQAAADTKQVLFVLTLAVLWCAGTASAREVVKELAIVRHERRFGLDLRAYLASKVLFLGAFVLFQAAALLAIVRLFTHLSGPPDLQFIILALTGLVGVTLGLCISAVSGTSERAMTVLPVSLIGLAIFSGGLARLTGVSQWLAWVGSPAYWSLDGLRAPQPTLLKNATYPGAPGTYQPPILGPGGPIVLDVGALLLQAAILLVVAWAALRLLLARPVR